MVELITEMLLYLALAAILGLVLGYLIWGWGAASRLAEARALGAETARNPVDAGAALRERLQECEAVRQRQSDEIQDLTEQLAEAQAAVTGAPETVLGDGSDTDLPSEQEPALEVPQVTDETSRAAAATPRGLLTERPQAVDDLKRIKGVGKVMEGVLNAKGIYLFRQLAALDAREIAWVNEAIEAFPGRIERDRWVEQAQELYFQKYGQRHDDDVAS